MPGAIDWEEVGCQWLGRLLLCTHIPRTTLPPMSPSHMSAPMWSDPLYIDFCAGDLGSGQALGSGTAGAGPQPSRSLLCREGGDRIKLQLAWWTTWLSQKELQPVPSVSQGCAWGREGAHQGLFTEAGCGAAWLLQCPPPSPTPACLPELSQSHSMGCGPPSPWIQSRTGSCPEHRCVTREGMAASATTKWPRPHTG